MSPFQSLSKSRKFLLLVLDTLIALVLFFVGKYVPTAAEDINFVIAALQPVFVSIIIAISIEDAAEKSTGSAG